MTQVIDEKSERVAKRFEVPMIIAAVLVIPTIIIEQSGVGGSLETLGVILNYLVWGAFLGEACVMLWITPNKLQWVRQNPIEVIIVVLTPPFLMAALQPVRLLRLFRLLRLLRLAPLVRHLFSSEGIKAVAGLAFLTMIAGGAAFQQTEPGQSFGEGLYWALTTMTTVGADVTPHTAAGKVVASIVMLVGIGTIALFTGAIAQAFIKPKATVPENGLDGKISTEDELLAQVRELSSKTQELERALEAKLGA
jgi:voltage-gated potassium channel